MVTIAVGTTANLDGAAAPVPSLNRQGTNTRVYQDSTATVVQGIMNGQNAVLITPTLAGSGGTFTMDQCTIWFDGTTGAAQDFSRVTPVTFNFTNGQINYTGGITNAQGGPFIRARESTSGTALAHVINIAGTALNNFNHNDANPTAGAQPGLNVNSIDVSLSNITGVSFNKYWFNTLADLASIGVDFSNSTYRPITNAASRYHVRINRTVDAATRSSIFAGCRFDGDFGQLPGGTSAGLQLFGNVQNTAITPSFNSIFLLDCIFPTSGNLSVNGFTFTGSTSIGTFRAVRSWNPRVRDSERDLISDVRIKFNTTSNILYPAPSGALTRTYNPTPAINNSPINATGYYRQSSSVGINIDAAGSGTSSGTLNYNFSSGTPFIFSSYTHRPANNTWAYNSVHGTGRDGIVFDSNNIPDGRSLGQPANENTISYDVDLFVEAISASAITVAGATIQATANDVYRFFKKIIHESATVLDWSNFVSYSGTEISFVPSLTLGAVNNTTAVTSSTTALNVRTGATLSISTLTAGSHVTKICAPTIALGSTRIVEFNVTATTSFTTPLYTTLLSPVHAFEMCRVTGRIDVDGTAANRFISFANDAITQASTGSFSRTAGTNPVFVLNRPPGMTLPTGANAGEVLDAPFTVNIAVVISAPDTVVRGENNVRMDIFNTTGGTLVSDPPIVENFLGSSISSGESSLSTLGKVGGITDIRFVISGPGINDTVSEFSVGANSSQTDLTATISVSEDNAYSSAADFSTAQTVGGVAITDIRNTITSTWDTVANRIRLRISGFATNSASNIATNRILHNAKGRLAYNQALAHHNTSIIVSPSAAETNIRSGTYIIENGEASGQQQITSVRDFANNGDLTDPVVRVMAGMAMLNEVIIFPNPLGATDAQIARAIAASNITQTVEINNNITEARNSINSNIETLY